MSALTLYSLPVSNYSARVRYLAERKQLGDIMDIKTPFDIGGFKSEPYLALNPLGKIPSLQIHAPAPSTVLYESSAICEYLAERYADHGPSFIPASAEDRAKARMIVNMLDAYIGQYHLYMYRAVEDDRVKGVANMNQGFDAIESILSEKGPYAIGEELSVADCCLWGNWPFYEYMLPTFFGWNPTDGRPKLKAWVEHMRQESSAAKKMYNEVHEGLVSWWDSGRWEKLEMKAINPPQNLFL